MKSRRENCKSYKFLPNLKWFRQLLLQICCLLYASLCWAISTPCVQLPLADIPWIRHVQYSGVFNTMQASLSHLMHQFTRISTFSRLSHSACSAKNCLDSATLPNCRGRYHNLVPLVSSMNLKPGIYGLCCQVWLPAWDESASHESHLNNVPLLLLLRSRKYLETFL